MNNTNRKVLAIKVFKRELALYMTLDPHLRMAFFPKNYKCCNNQI